VGSPLPLGPDEAEVAAADGVVGLVDVVAYPAALDGRPGSRDGEPGPRDRESRPRDGEPGPKDGADE